MRHERQGHHRRSIRLAEYDYGQAGAYFVTICTHDHKSLFGRMIGDRVHLNGFGRTVEDEWRRTDSLRKNLQLDAHAVMPNHFHGILFMTLEGQGTARRAPTVEQFGRPVSASLPTIVRSFKSAVTRSINAVRNTPGARVWQRNYYEHVIRSEQDMNRIREYIVANPAQWAFDRENPNRTGPAVCDHFW